MSLFNRFYYHGSVEFYTYILACLFKDIKVYTEGKLVTIPVAYFGGKHNTVQSAIGNTLVMPRGTLKFESIDTSNFEQLNKHMQRLRSSGDPTVFGHQRIKGAFDFTVAFKCKKSLEAFQLVEQVVPAFYPTLDILVKETESYQTEQNVKIELTDHSITDNYDGEGEEPVSYNVEFKFRVNGHFYRRPSEFNLIRTINIEIFLSDTGELVDQITVTE